jgi:hypothetical protein
MKRYEFECLLGHGNPTVGRPKDGDPSILLSSSKSTVPPANGVLPQDDIAFLFSRLAIRLRALLDVVDNVDGNADILSSRLVLRVCVCIQMCLELLYFEFEHAL